MSLTTQSKPKAYHRKRQGDHHHHSSRYLKTYWPYIPMLLIVVSGIGINSLLVSRSHVLSAQADFSRTSLLGDTNKDRAADNQPDLRFSSQLNSAAQAKATDMANNNYWAHTSPSGKTPWSFIAASGYEYQAAGENLAYGFNSASAVVAAWMNSPEHRANMLNGSYEDVGFGVAEASNYLGSGPKVIVVAEYAEPIIAVPSPNVTPVLSAANSQPVSRLSLWSGSQSTWLVLVVTALTGAAIATIIIRHALYLRKLISRSEKLILSHPLLDILVVFIATAGIILTHTAGIIN